MKIALPSLNRIILSFSFITLISCGPDKHYTSPEIKPTITFRKSVTAAKKLNSTTKWLDTFLVDHFLPKDLIKNYPSDSCTILPHSYKEIKDDFEGIKPAGHITNSHKLDSVFVLPPLTFCEEGESYYFTDASLPRLQTDSYCCHPENILVTDDIDEDGIREIVVYYSSCASRFKALLVYSLKERKWTEVGSVVYDTFQEPIPMRKRIRKLGRGRFQLLELTDASIKSMGKNGAWIDHRL